MAPCNRNIFEYSMAMCKEQKHFEYSMAMCKEQKHF